MAFFSSGNSAIRRAFGAGPLRGRSLGGYGVFWLKALRQPTIDLTIRTHAGLITRIVETPGLSLSEVELGELVSQLRIVAAKTLPEESLTYGIFSGDRERLSRAIVTLISRKRPDGRLPSTRCR
jgi:hypothetical protein